MTSIPNSPFVKPDTVSPRGSVSQLVSPTTPVKDFPFFISGAGGSMSKGYNPFIPSSSAPPLPSTPSPSIVRSELCYPPSNTFWFPFSEKTSSTKWVKTLDLSKNCLNCLTYDIGNFTNLTNLKLDDNLFVMVFIISRLRADIVRYLVAFNFCVNFKVSV